jgi:hypothetical protein
MSNNFNMNNFNDFLQKASNTLLCDSECQQQKKAKQLQEEYLSAQTNQKMAAYNIANKEKQYITLTQGTAAYNELQTNQLNTKAGKIISMFLDNFNNEVSRTIRNNQTYSGLLTNYNNIYELYLTYKKDNLQLKKQYQDDTSDVATNDRKTYYETQQVDFLHFIYKYVLSIIYVITVIVYFISVFFYPSPFNWKIKFVVLLFLIALPFISTWLLSHFIALIYNVYNLLPKNVYKNL